MQIHRYMTGPLSVNTYLVVNEETNKGFIVDPGGKDKNLLEYVKDHDIQIEYIILTHGHADHTGGLEDYKSAWPEASVVAHEEEKQLLSDPGMNFSRETFGRPFSIEADRYVKDGDQINAGGIELKFFFTPGHTPGGMSIYAGDILFSGDTLFAGSVGRTDFPGSSFAALKEGIEEKLYTLPGETVVYPGHMGPTTIRKEKEQNPFV